jgi:hypothetical protein
MLVCAINAESYLASVSQVTIATHALSICDSSNCHLDNAVLQLRQSAVWRL